MTNTMAFSDINLKNEISTYLPRIKEFLLTLQRDICHFAEKEDGNLFLREEWRHGEGGGGITCVLSGESVFEKAGVNFSHVTGKALPSAATAKRPELANAPFDAMGVSVVMHPKNPHVPTSHFNVRFITVETEAKSFYWFGGGFDMTPYYLNQDDAIHFHAMAKSACDPFGESVYPAYKKWADEYFYLKHRNEPRGIGGIFFDDLSDWTIEKGFQFIQSVGQHYIKAYQPIVAKRKSTPFTDAERAFQLYRRGRYVEFNLLYDRGTLFGLQSGGRTESILMSLPPVVTFEYDKRFPKGTPEGDLLDYLTPPRDWV